MKQMESGAVFAFFIYFRTFSNTSKTFAKHTRASLLVVKTMQTCLKYREKCHKMNFFQYLAKLHFMSQHNYTNVNIIMIKES